MDEGYLSKDVYSKVNKKVLYGKFGEKVEVISDYGNVLIVRHLVARNLFPLSKEDFTNIERKVVELEVIKEKRPIKFLPSKEENKEQAVTKINTQQSLF